MRSVNSWCLNLIFVRSNLLGSQLLLQMESLNDFGSQKKRVEKRCIKEKRLKKSIRLQKL